MGERRLPLVEAPIAFVTPRTARLLIASWPGLEQHYREQGVRVPPELVDLIEACRVLAARPISVDGSAVDDEAETDPGSADATTNEGGRFTETVEEAGRRLELTGRRVRQLVGEGRIAGRQTDGGMWLLDPASIEEYGAARASSG